MTVFYAVLLIAAGLLLAFGPQIDRWIRKTPTPSPPVQYAPLEKPAPLPQRQLPAVRLLNAATVLDPIHRWPPAPDLPLLPHHLAQQLHDEAHSITRQAAANRDTG